MGDIQTRPFSKNYSGLINQSVIGLAIFSIGVTAQELMKRRRRGKMGKWIHTEGLGSRETWEFGYLYQGRSWARHPSPRAPTGWPLSWIKESIWFPPEKMCELRGIDATLYIRFLRGCWWFTLIHTLTTLPVLFPIHVHFSSNQESTRSMTRASISSLVETQAGKNLLWVHIILLIWITLSWVGTLLWICHGAFQMRATKIEWVAQAATTQDLADKQAEYYPPPHPQFAFIDVPELERHNAERGLRLRTVMVSNVPPQLRKREKDLQEYFEYYMCRPLAKPAMGLTSSTQPGFLNKSFAFLFHRARRLPAHLPHVGGPPTHQQETVEPAPDKNPNSHVEPNNDKFPVIDKVVICRKMTELASLLERREDVLRRLETAHIKLAKDTLAAVREEMDRRSHARPGNRRQASQISMAEMNRSSASPGALERGEGEGAKVDPEAQMDLLIETLAPFVHEFGVKPSRGTRLVRSSTALFSKHPEEEGALTDMTKKRVASPSDMDGFREGDTIWDALLKLPRSATDPYQPLIHLSALFRGRTVPAIDYYTAKLGLLTSLITENRARAVGDYDPVSTAFVTFADPADARRACKYLAVHPNNPLACLVTMAPQYDDLDWFRIMKSTFRAEFVKDWVVNAGVWAFTIFWLFPVSLLVTLVSIESIGQFWPGLKNYLDEHSWEEDLIQSFLPTLLVALLALLIPLILLLIAKKAHTIPTLSALQDLILTRYYKFLIVNVLVFFCVGTAAVQSVLLSIKSTTGDDILKIVASSFPTAGPFYVGWLLFTSGMHAGLEIGLLGLPLMVYPSTSRQVTPRKRTVGIRPRTLNFYYWLPNHTLVVHVLLLFAVLNPLVIPFGLVYFSIERVVIQNQLLHVYAKNYENNGKVLLIRFMRYSLDGLILSQTVFMAYMVVLKNKANIGLSVVLIVGTIATKLFMTRLVRAQYERDDITEADVLCGQSGRTPSTTDPEPDLVNDQPAETAERPAEPQERLHHTQTASRLRTWKVPEWVNFSYSTRVRRPRAHQRRPPLPFSTSRPTFSRLGSMDDSQQAGAEPREPMGGKPNLTIGVPPAALNQDQHDAIRHQLDVSGRALVIRHPPPLAWDDENPLDLPYDNPYYTRPISNALWLPRNPCGTLDLDDTVDMRQSICSIEKTGQLGVWLGQSALVSSPMPASGPPSNVVVTPASPVMSPQLQTVQLPETVVDGTEEIELPPGIANRVRSSKEGDIETTLARRPSFFNNRRRRSSAAQESVADSIQSFRRAPTFDGQSTPSGTGSRFGRSMSVHGGRIPRQPSSTLISGEFGRRAVSAGQDPANRPDVHAQGDLVNRSRMSVVAGASASAVSVGRQPRSALSPDEALMHEVIAEEQEATKERLKEEEEEAQEKSASKSWLTSWMFSRGH